MSDAASDVAGGCAHPCACTHVPYHERIDEGFVNFVNNQLRRLLLAARGPRQILDVLQIGAAEVLLETQDSLNFSISQHCYEYCNTLGWFYDSFEHPQRLKLLYSAASFLNRDPWHQRNIGDGKAHVAELPAGAERMSGAQLLERTLTVILALDGPQAVAWARAHLANSGDRQVLVQQLALTACRLGNDAHNQEIAQCLLEDYAKNGGFDRDQHTAVHRKYGDFLNAVAATDGPRALRRWPDERPPAPGAKSIASLSSFPAIAPRRVARPRP